MLKWIQNTKTEPVKSNVDLIKDHLNIIQKLVLKIR